MSTVRIQLRRGISTEWTSVNPVLAGGEAGFESDTLKIKIGDGTSHWNDLDYATVTPQNLTDAINAAITGTIDTTFATITDLENAIAQEVSDRDSAIATAVAYVTTGANLYTDDAVANEESRATAAELALETRITNEVTARGTAVSTALANAESYVDGKIDSLVNGSPALLDTLNELATALGDDPNFATTITNSIAGIRTNGTLTNTRLNSPTLDAATFIGDATFGGNIVSGAETINGSQLVNGSIGETQIHNESITTEKIANAAITSAKIPDASIANGKLISRTITGAKIALATVADENLATGTITANSLSDGAVTVEKLHDSAVTANKLATGAVTTAKIEDGAVTNDKIVSITIDKVTDLGTDLADKAPLASPTFTGTVVLPSTTSIGNVSNTEIGYLDGVTSAVQNQLDAKASTSSLTSHTSATTNVHGISDTAELATKTYADTKKSEAITASESYTDSAISAEVTNRNSAIVTATTGIVKTTDNGSVTSTMIADGTIINGDISSSAAIALSKLAIDPLARANHTGTQTSLTILDFAEAAQDAVGGILGSGLTYIDSANTITVDSSVIQLRVSGVSDTEIGYLDGVTSSLQTQLDDKLSKSGGTMTGALTLSGAPTSDLHAATKLYVDGVSAGINFHKAVKIATVNNWSAVYANGTNGFGATLTASVNQSINPADGVTLSVGDRILVKSQTDAKQNGIYDVTNIGGASSKWVLTRSADADNNPSGEVSGGDFTFVTEGSTNANTGFILSSPSGAAILGTDNINYTQFNAAQAIVAGTGLAKSGGTISIDTNTTVDKTTAQTLTNKAVTGTFTGPLTGNADTATKLATARNINGVAFDGSQAITVKASTTNALTIGTGLSGTSFDGSGTATIAIDSTVATLSGTQTLTNKTLTSPSISNAAMSGTSTYASGGKIQFSDGTQQSTAGVPSLTTIGTSISASTTIGAGLTDQMIPVAGTVNITIPTNATTAYAVGTSIDFYQASGSAAAFVAASGVTFINTPGLKMRATGSVATAMKVATDTWLIFGDLTA